MENMPNRKIKLVVRSSILGLSELETDEFEVIVSLPDNKKTYQELAKNENILDWDFLEESEEGEEKKKEEEGKLNEEELFASRIIDHLGINTFNDAATFLEAAQRVGLFSPAIIFGNNNLFHTAIFEKYKEVSESPVSPEHALCVIIMRTYYGELTPINEVIVHLLIELKKLWKTIGEYKTLGSLTYKLYKK